MLNTQQIQRVPQITFRRAARSHSPLGQLMMKHTRSASTVVTPVVILVAAVVGCSTARNDKSVPCVSVSGLDAIDYRVQPSDMIESLAYMFVLNPEDIREANNIPEGRQVAPGTLLKIPAAGKEERRATSWPIPLEPRPRGNTD